MPQGLTQMLYIGQRKQFCLRANNPRFHDPSLMLFKMYSKWKFIIDLHNFLIDVNAD